MTPTSAKAPAERRERPGLPLPPAPAPVTKPESVADLAAMHAGVGNSAIAAAVSSGSLAPSSDIFSLQSIYGNAAAARAAEGAERTPARPQYDMEEQSGIAPKTPSAPRPEFTVVAPQAPPRFLPERKRESAVESAPLPGIEGTTPIRREVEGPRAEPISVPPAQPETAEAEAKPATRPAERMPTTEKPFGTFQPKPGEEVPIAPAEAGAAVPVEAKAKPATVPGVEPEGAAAKAPTAGPTGEAKGEVSAGGAKTLAEVPEAGAGAAAAPAQATVPPMDTSSFEGVLQSLAATPPSAASEALAKATAATPTLQAQEKADLEASFPQVERPSGLPRLAERNPHTPTALEKGEPPELAEEKGREGKPPEVEHEEAQGPLPGKDLSTAVREPPVEEEGSWWEQIFKQVRSFTAALPTHDPGVSTDAGPRPNVDLTGEANPDQNAQSQEASDEEVNMRRAGAGGAIQEDFGENEIYPDVPEETLRPSYKPAPPPAGPGGTGKTVEGLSGQELAMFDQTTGPWYTGKVGEQQEKQRMEQEAYRAKSEEARADGQRQIAEETEKTSADQQAMQGQARGDVDAERERWRQENQKIQDDYATQSEPNGKKSTSRSPRKRLMPKKKQTKNSPKRRPREKRSAKKPRPRPRRKSGRKSKNRGAGGSASREPYPACSMRSRRSSTRFSMGFAHSSKEFSS